MININLDTFSTLLLSILLLLMGTYIKSRSNLLNRFCIPSPVISGLLFSILAFLLKYFDLISMSMNTSLMDYFILLFFVTVGLSISLSSIKKGGTSLIKYWVLGCILAVSQNILAVFLSKFLDIHPLISLMCGSISMEGGHGYSAAFGYTIESLGIDGAISVGITASTFGLILAGLIGSPVGKFLIEKHNLVIKNTSTIRLSARKSNTTLYRSSGLNLSFLLEQILVIMVCVSFGKFISYILLNITNVNIPSVVGCIFISTLFRNINDNILFVKLDYDLIDFLGEIFLGLFLTMALMSIDLFKLSSFLVPILFIVLCQSVFIILYSIFVCFKILGKNFDSAIMISGLIGHGLGATPVALANMNSLCDKYGDSHKAFLIVPLVAAVLLDVFTLPCIVFFINSFQ